MKNPAQKVFEGLALILALTLAIAIHDALTGRNSFKRVRDETSPMKTGTPRVHGL